MTRRFLERRCGLWLLAAGLLLLPQWAFGARDDAVSALREKIDRAERERLEICKTLGAIYEQLGDAEKALACYRMAFQVFPEDTFVCEKLRGLYTAREEWGELVAVYQSLVYANPGASQTYMGNLAECLFRGGRHQEGVAVVEEMLREYGDDASEYRDAAQLLMNYEQYEAAARVCRKAIEEEFGKSCDLHGMLGRALGKAGKYGEALLAYEKAIELCRVPRDRRILQQELDDLWGKTPIIEPVLEERTKLLDDIDRRLAGLYWQRALLEEKDGNFDAAVGLYRRIVSLVPDSEIGNDAGRKIKELVHE